MPSLLLAGFLFIAFGILGTPAQAKPAPMPDFTGIARWFNTSSPPTAATLKGKVVIVDFWTYSCINCVRSVPQMKMLYDKYHPLGLEIIGIHTPEFDFEKEPGNVQAAIEKFGLPYPIAMDNQYKTWDSFANHNWPADYIVDREGMVRYHHFGEGNDAAIEKEVRGLLAENNPAFGHPSRTAFPHGPDFSKINTDEIYAGFGKLSNFGNVDEHAVPLGVRQTFREPARLLDDRFYVEGDWRFEREYALLESAQGRLTLCFDAAQANAVLSVDDGHTAVADVWIDGKPATAGNKGADVVLDGDNALCRVRQARLYNLVRAGYGKHRVELRLRQNGLKVYSFTFG